MENKMSEFADTKVIKNLIEQYNNNDINNLILLQKIKNLIEQYNNNDINTLMLLRKVKKI